MQVLFSPAIGEAISIPLSESRAPSDTLVLQFKASLGKEDYTRVAKGHARVQLWSNIPVASGQPRHHWRALDFLVTDERLVSVARSPPPHGPHTAGASRWVNLATADQEGLPAAVEQLVLEIPVDLSAFRGEQRYGFTYRIVWGDGGITWLGAHGRDGTVVLSGTRMAEVALEDGWRQAGNAVGGHGLVCDLEDDTQGQGIAKFSNLGDYQVWAFDNNQVLQSSSSFPIQNARALVILPRKQGQRQFNEPAFVLSASGSTLLDVSPSTGIVTGGGSGNVLLQTCHSPRHLLTLVPGGLAFSGLADKVRVVKSERWMLLLSPRNQSPAKGLFIPLTSPKDRGYVTITLDFAALAEILTSPLKESVPPEFCVFSPLTYDLEYIDTRRTVESPVDGESDVSFGVPSYGGEFTLSKVYGLTGQESDSKCKAALLTSHDSVAVSHGAVVKPIVLPTPPPSPFLNHRNSRSSPTVTFSPDPVVIPRVDTIDIDGQLLRRRSSVAKSDGGSQEAASSTSDNQQAQRRSESSAAVARRRGLFGLIRGIFSIIRLYTGAVFYLIYLMSLAPLLGRRAASPSTSASAEAEAKAGAEIGPVKASASATAGAGVSFDVAGEESDDSDETSSDVTVTGDEQNIHLGQDDDRSTAESSPAPEEAQVKDAFHPAIHSDKDASATVSSNEELLSAELHPKFDQQPGSEVWARLVLMTSGAKDNNDSTSGGVTLPSLCKTITLNGDVPDAISVRALKDGDKTAHDAWAYHLVEFPISTPSKTDTTILKILNCV